MKQICLFFLLVICSLKMFAAYIDKDRWDDAADAFFNLPIDLMKNKIARMSPENRERLLIRMREISEVRLAKLFEQKKAVYEKDERILKIDSWKIDLLSVDEQSKLRYGKGLTRSPEVDSISKFLVLLKYWDADSVIKLLLDRSKSVETALEINPHPKVKNARNNFSPEKS